MSSKSWRYKAERRSNWYKRRGFFNEIADPYKYIHVDSREIKFNDTRLIKDTKKKKGSKFDDFGRIINGDWDIQSEKTTPCYGNAFYRSVQQRIAHKMPWERTEIWKTKLKVIKQGRIVDKCKTKEDLRRRYERLDVIIRQILEENMMRTQKQIPEGKFPGGELTVSIGRHGQFFLASGGRHRIAIAQFLNLPVSVLVLCRHKQWQMVRESRPSFTHPDLLDVSGR